MAIVRLGGENGVEVSEYGTRVDIGACFEADGAVHWWGGRPAATLTATEALALIGALTAVGSLLTEVSLDDLRFQAYRKAREVAQ
jgi:hypothetical protein